MDNIFLFRYQNDRSPKVQEINYKVWNLGDQNDNNMKV